MKRFVTLLLAAAVGAAAAWFFVSNHLARTHTAALAVWDAERARLESALRDRKSEPAFDRPVARPEPAAGPAAQQTSPREALQKLIALRVSSTQPKTIRQAVVLFESLVDAGPEALPIIREFLATFQDTDYDAELNGLRRGWRDNRLETDFVLAPSLRIGLLDVVRQIGGEPAEKILADTLSATGRGVEVAYLASVLQTLTPNKYRAAALIVARDLLTYPPSAAQPGRLDRNHREYLFGVLAMYSDTSFGSYALAQLVRPDGEIDKAALRFLERTAEDQVLAAVAQAYQNPAITNALGKEPLVEAVVERAGTHPQADQLLYAMVTDQSLPLRLRESAIRELDDDGINEDNPSDRDRQIALARMHVLEALKPDVTDPKLAGYVERVQQNLQQIATKPPRQPPDGRRP